MRCVRRQLEPGEIDLELLTLAVSLGGLGLAASWLALHLPWPICLFHAITGHPCATCGATRSAMAFFHGQFFTALKWNPLAFVFYCGLSIFNAYALAVLILRKPRLRIGSLSAVERRFSRYAFLGLFALNWVYVLIANPSL